MSNPQPNVRRQNLLDFTVRICHATTDAVVGAGVVISSDVQIVTCAHVLRDATGADPQDGAEVGVYFPLVRGETKSWRARCMGRLPLHDDDIVLLQLVGGAAPLGPEQIAVLGTAEQSPGHEFQSYGYRRLENYRAGYAEGKIMGPVEPPTGKQLQVWPVELRTRDIRPGMSGAAVLDVERNLVVGLVAQRYNPGDKPTDDNVGWAVDCQVLTFDPFSVPLHDAPLPLRPAPQSKVDVEVARAAAVPKPGVVLHSAPPPLPEWTGRAELLRQIGVDCADPAKRMTGLIGFGGEGKSSLARRWLDDLLADSALPQPDGVFWWGFYDRPGVDEFFESALSFMSGGQIDPRAYPSASARAHLIAAMLATKRYLFVLDGLEVLQHQEGDQYGLLTSNDLREFLQFFAAPVHQSFCLITSRTPLFDLQSYTTYTHRDVDRLSAADGRALLHRLGVKGSDAALDKVVSDWDGHALTLSLLAAYLADRHAGDAAHIGDIPAPTANEPRYQRVHRVLRRYDEHLSAAERAFLTLFSAFRTPVREDAFEKVFRTTIDTSALKEPVSMLDDAAFKNMLERLRGYRILRYDAHKQHYTSHLLIRAHYLDQLNTSIPIRVIQNIYACISDYYYDDYLAHDTSNPTQDLSNPTLEDLAPLIEAVYHACRAGRYDRADQIVWADIQQGTAFTTRNVLTSQLGAYETALAMLLEFFPNKDTAQEPQVSSPLAKHRILNNIGLYLTYLGRLVEAQSLYKRSINGDLEHKEWHRASLGYQNLSQLYSYLGALASSADAASIALALARRAKNKEDKRNSLKWQAWADHLSGDLQAASTRFQQAEALERDIASGNRYLYGLRGIQHAHHLRRTSDLAYARHVTEANLAGCEYAHWPQVISQCHYILGDLDADAGQHDQARRHYDEALKIARSISRRDILIEALLAHGRWAARRGDVAARADLDEALGYATISGYRIYEADIRIGLAWAHYAAGDPALARAEATRARRMSEEMGYHWGQVDADEVLAAIDAAAGGGT